MADKANYNEHLQGLLDYLSDNLTAEERYRFERETECDPFDYEAMEGFRSLKIHDIQKDLRSMNMHSQKSLPKKTLAIVGISIIAIAAILGAMLILNNLPPRDRTVRNTPILEQEQPTPVDSSLFVRQDSKEDQVESAVATAEPTAESQSEISKIAMSSSDKIINYKGIIVNSESKRPMPGVVVSVKNSSRQTVTGFDGSFSLDLAESTHPVFVAKFDGMEEKQFILKTESETISISPESIERPTDQTPVAIRNDRNEKSEKVSSTPIGGMAKYEEYLHRNLKYPTGLSNPKFEVVSVNFLVKVDGQPIRLEVTKSPGQAFTQEAIRIILEGPRWNPATVNGIPTIGDVSLKITFQP